MTEIFKIYPFKSDWEIAKLFFYISINQRGHMKNFVISYASAGIVDALRFFQPGWFKSLKYEGSLLILWSVMFLMLFLGLFLVFVIIFLFARNKGGQFSDSEILIYKENVLKDRISFSELTDINFEKFDVKISYIRNNRPHILVFYKPASKLINLLMNLKQTLSLN